MSLLWKGNSFSFFLFFFSLFISLFCLVEGIKYRSGEQEREREEKEIGERGDWRRIWEQEKKRREEGRKERKERREKDRESSRKERKERKERDRGNWEREEEEKERGEEGEKEREREGRKEREEKIAEEREEERKDVFVIHLVPHSHWDPGWKKPFQTYFFDKVNPCIDSILEALQESEERRFLFSEVSFLSSWWDEQLSNDNPESLELFRNAVSRHALEITGGGWVEHDELLTSFDMQVQQMAFGHNWLRQNELPIPTVGWQIDVFGHSANTGALLPGFGFSEVVLNRIPWDQKYTWRKSHNMEFFWNLQWKGKRELGREKMEDDNQNNKSPHSFSNSYLPLSLDEKTSKSPILNNERSSPSSLLSLGDEGQSGSVDSVFGNGKSRSILQVNDYQNNQNNQNNQKNENYQNNQNNQKNENYNKHQQTNPLNYLPISHVLYDHYNFPLLEEKHFPFTAERLLNEAALQFGAYNHRHLMILMGDDFRWASHQEVSAKFRTIESVIKDVNSPTHPLSWYQQFGFPNRVHARMSTPTEYFQAVRRSLSQNEVLPPITPPPEKFYFPSSLALFLSHFSFFSPPSPSPLSLLSQEKERSSFSLPFPRREGNLYPYSTHPRSVWSGFYSTRPYLKRVIVRLAVVSRVASILFALVCGNSDSHIVETGCTIQMRKNLEDAQKSVYLGGHHDAITGTSLPFVIEDYQSLFLRANIQLTGIANELLSLLFRSKPNRTLEKESKKEEEEKIIVKKKIRANYPKKKKGPKKNEVRGSERRTNELWEAHKLAGIQSVSMQLGSFETHLEPILCSNIRESLVPLRVFNPTTFSRKELITIWADCPFVQILDLNGAVVQTQSTPLLNTDIVHKEVIKNYHENQEKNQSIKIEDLSKSSKLFRICWVGEIGGLQGLTWFASYGAPQHSSSAEIIKPNEFSNDEDNNKIQGNEKAVHFCQDGFQICKIVDLTLSREWDIEQSYLRYPSIFSGTYMLRTELGTFLWEGLLRGALETLKYDWPFVALCYFVVLLGCLYFWLSSPQHQDNPWIFLTARYLPPPTSSLYSLLSLSFLIFLSYFHLLFPSFLFLYGLSVGTTGLQFLGEDGVDYGKTTGKYLFIFVPLIVTIWVLFFLKIKNKRVREREEWEGVLWRHWRIGREWGERDFTNGKKERGGKRGENKLRGLWGGLRKSFFLVCLCLFGFALGIGAGLFFCQDRHALPIEAQDPIVIAINGPLFSERIGIFSFDANEEGVFYTSYIMQSVRVFSVPLSGKTSSEDFQFLDFIELSIEADTIDYNELILRFQTKLSTDQVFATSNGVTLTYHSSSLFSLIPSLFSPSISLVEIKDKYTHDSFQIFHSQPLGVTSLASGQCDILLHRKPLRDDGAGLSEGLGNEFNAPFLGTFSLRMSTGQNRNQRGEERKEREARERERKEKKRMKERGMWEEEIELEDQVASLAFVNPLFLSVGTSINSISDLSVFSFSFLSAPSVPHLHLAGAFVQQSPNQSPNFHTSSLFFQIIDYGTKNQNIENQLSPKDLVNQLVAGQVVEEVNLLGGEFCDNPLLETRQISKTGVQATGWLVSGDSSFHQNQRHPTPCLSKELNWKQENVSASMTSWRSFVVFGIILLIVFKCGFGQFKSHFFPTRFQKKKEEEE